jgi:phasin family protein
MAKKAASKPADPARHVIEVALRLAAERGWAGLALADIAAAAKLRLADLYATYPSKTAILIGLSRQVDRQVLAGLETGTDESTRDRLFDLIMKRFDALAPYRDGLSAVARDARRDPLAALCGMGQLARSMALMLEAAGVSSSGLTGTLRTKGWGRSTWRPCATGSRRQQRQGPHQAALDARCGGPRAGRGGSTGGAARRRARVEELLTMNCCTAKKSLTQVQHAHILGSSLCSAAFQSQPDPEREFRPMAKATNPMFDTEAFKVPDFTKFYGDFNKAAADFGKLFVNGKAPTFDFEAAIASQRKNVEAFTAANRIAVEGTQAVLRRQAELVREAIEEMSSVSKEFTAAGSAEDKLLKQTELAKTAFESVLANVRELSGLVQKASDEAVSVISKRVVDNFDEVRTALQPKIANKK